MAGNPKDSKILAYKDMINQLNKTISAQTERIQSLQKTLEADRLEKENLRQQIEYLTKKLFGTSSKKRKDIDGQLNLFDEAGQEEDWKQLGVPLSGLRLLTGSFTVPRIISVMFMIIFTVSYGCVNI